MRLRPPRPPLRRPRLLVEELDPRILYSADAAALLGLAGGPGAAEVREFSPAPVATVQPSSTAAQMQAAREIVFIDSRAPDALALADQLLQQRGTGAMVDIVVLDAHSDGIAQINRVLASEHGLAAVHLISHGSEGAVQLGSSVLDAATLAREGEAVARWGEALGADGDLLLYGCNVAAGAAGQLFLRDLGALTGADVAASTGLTGSAAIGGNWTLEFATGTVHTQFTPAGFDALQWQGVLATFTVTNTSDNGAGSLRQAIQNANANGIGLDLIHFNIGGTGIHTINLGSALSVQGAVTIDATTDDSFGANGSRPAIVLSGQGLVTDGFQLYTNSGGSTIRGFVIQNFTQDGIDVASSNGNTIVGNWIGLNSAGTGAAGNQQGVNLWNSSFNIIGGSTPADRNVISGNSGPGININTDNGTSTDNQIRGNYIGTRVDGLAAVGNGNQGIYINAQNNTVGGTANGQGNVISGTLNWAGVSLQTGSSGTLVAGNLIGLNATGNATLANNGPGIEVYSANNTLGGTTAASRNVIAGTAANSARIMITGASATGNVVIGNYIGTDITGTLDLDGAAQSGGASGVVMTNGASFNRIGTDADGSDDALERNVISGNNWYGVEMIGPTTASNLVQGNYIGTTASGLAALGNSNGGTSFWNGAHDNAVGSGLAGAGNVISGNGTGVLVASGVTNNRVQGNLIGLGADGLTAVGNTGAGVYLYNGGSGSAVTGNVIGTNADGSNDAAERNVISANVNGVALENAEVTGNTIAGNFIGTDASGLLGRGNTVDGVLLQAGAHGNSVGGSAASQRNVISGNGAQGVRIDGEASDGNTVRGNWIGVNAAGSATLGNAGNGIFIVGGADNTLVGGTGANEGNWIASNSVVGVEVDGNATGTVIQGNRIGTDLAGHRQLGHNENGILLEGGASSTVVGGTTAAAANIIAFSGQGGVWNAGIDISGASSVNNVVLRNSIYSSVGLGIDFGGDGVTANDATDSDTGPNGQLNAVVLNTATTTGAELRLNGTYTGAANTYYRVEVFGNTSAEASGAGEGRTYLGTVNLPVGPSGTVTGSYSFAATVAAGTYISATVTRTDASYTTFYETSEFSNHVQARTVGITVTPTSGLVATEAGGTAQFSVVLDAAPTADVTVGMASGDTTEGTVSTASLSFTTANWNVAQVVTVTGVNDTLDDGDSAFTVTTTAAVSADTAYSGLNASDVAVTTTDDDSLNSVIVDTAADTADGNTTSLAALMTNRGADGFISLREAITAANNTANGSAADVIRFSIAGGGAQTIALTSSLPTVTDTLTIDGWTQAGYSGTPLIVIDGEQLASIGLRLGANADGSTVRGLVLRDFSSEAIQIDTGASGITIEGNYIGAFAPDGTDLGVSERNVANGIAVFGDHNTIGGASAASRNVIGGNQGSGIRLTGAGATDNTVLNNLIGVNAAGTAAMGNGVDGVRTDASPVRNAIGVAGFGNVISGNGASGISLGGGQTSVLGNLIGLNLSGTAAIANAGVGVRVEGIGNTIGGAAVGARNVISGNAYSGIFITGAALTGNAIASNYIGTNASGNAAVGNGQDGIWVDTGVTATTITGNLISGNANRGVYLKDGGNTVAGNIIGLDASGTAAIGNAVGVSIVSSGNTIGGVGVGEGNVIGGNLGAGVSITGATATGNAVIGNSFRANGGLAIDLGGDGVTANDASDADNGANDLQNTPVLASGHTDGSGQVRVSGTFDGAANANLRLEFFASTTADASGHGEGERVIGFLNVTTDGTGHADFSTVLSATVAVGEAIGATATLADAGFANFSHTSEFALNVAARAPNTVPTGTDGVAVGVEDTTLTLTLANFGFGDVDGDAFDRLVIASLPALGTLRSNGVALSAGATVLASDIALRPPDLHAPGRCQRCRLHELHVPGAGRRRHRARRGRPRHQCQHADDRRGGGQRCAGQQRARFADVRRRHPNADHRPVDHRPGRRHRPAAHRVDGDRWHPRCRQRRRRGGHRLGAPARWC